MIKFRYLFLTAVAALAATACQPPAANTNTANSNKTVNSNINANVAKPIAAAPTKETLLAMEKEAWEAWKNTDSKFFEGFLSDRWVSFGPNGREDKAANIKRLTDAKCEVKSYALSDEQMHMLGADVAVLSFKASQDATCAGTKIPANVWASSAYVREGDKWKALAYVENAVVDPNSAPAKTTPAPPALTTTPSGEAKADAMSDAVMAVETKAWDAWKNRDAKTIEALITSDFTYVGATGRYDRAASLKTWSEPKCEGNAYTFSEPKVISVTPDVALATYKADVKGKCDGRANPPAIWVASFNKKEGDTWKNAFYTDMPR
jgi:ketosteroid isomerase-like protein